MNKGVEDPDEAGRIVDEAVQSVKDRMLTVTGPPMLAHHVECLELHNMFLRKGQKNREMKYETAIKRGMKFCPHCFPQIQQELQKPVDEPKKAARKNLSPMDIMGMGDKKERAAFNRWINSKTPEQRKVLFESLQELDSIEEFRGLMSRSPKIRDEAVLLLKNRNAKHWLKGFFGTVGVCITLGYEKVVAAMQWLWSWFAEQWEALKRFDQSLTPLVQTQRARQQDIRTRRSTPLAWSFANFFRPF